MSGSPRPIACLLMMEDRLPRGPAGSQAGWEGSLGCQAFIGLPVPPFPGWGLQASRVHTSMHLVQTLAGLLGAPRWADSFAYVDPIFLTVLGSLTLFHR